MVVVITNLLVHLVVGLVENIYGARITRCVMGVKTFIALRHNSRGIRWWLDRSVI